MHIFYPKTCYRKLEKAGEWSIAAKQKYEHAIVRNDVLDQETVVKADQA